MLESVRETLPGLRAFDGLFEIQREHRSFGRVICGVICGVQ